MGVYPWLWVMNWSNFRNFLLLRLHSLWAPVHFSLLCDKIDSYFTDDKMSRESDQCSCGHFDVSCHWIDRSNSADKLVIQNFTRGKLHMHTETAVHKGRFHHLLYWFAFLQMTLQMLRNGAYCCLPTHRGHIRKRPIQFKAGNVVWMEVILFIFVEKVLKRYEAEWGCQWRRHNCMSKVTSTINPALIF